MSVNNNNKDLNQDKITELDIRGKACPMTFVYTKLILEKLNSGDKLKVILDFPPAVENIPENCRRQDLAKLLKIKEIGKKDSKDKIWQLILKKKL